MLLLFTCLRSRRCRMSENITVEVEGKIMSEIAELTEGEKDSALARVSGSARFSKMMEDCKSDELGVRVQKQSELANRMMKESLSMLVKKIAVKHCRNAMEEVRKLKQVNLQLIEENKQLRKEETRNVLRQLVLTADQGSLLQDIRNTDASSNS